jgi:mono/diheme cytochrome c family protein
MKVIYLRNRSYRFRFFRRGVRGTMMGKKLGVKDFTKEQSSDAEATNVIKNGKGNMNGYKDKLSDADVTELVAYVRSLKK